MRRKDREMSKEFALKLIDKSQYGVLSILNKDLPYQIPLSIVRDKDKLYFHSATVGEKITYFKKNKEVSIVFVGQVKVPQLYSKNEVVQMKNRGQIGQIVSKVYTTEFESAIVKGSLTKVDNETERKKVMKLICDKYVPKMDFIFEDAYEMSKSRLGIYRIDIKEVTGKRKKFDKDRKEIKNQD